MKAHILVIDDDDLIRDAAALLLETEGYQVTTAEHGRAALDLLRDGLRPDLIVLDMPVMSGWEFRALQRADPRFRFIPVIVTTGWGVKHTRRMGPVDVVCKPLPLDDLAARVEERLRLAA